MLELRFKCLQNYVVAHQCYIFVVADQIRIRWQIRSQSGKDFNLTKPDWIRIKKVTPQTSGSYQKNTTLRSFVILMVTLAISEACVNR